MGAMADPGKGSDERRRKADPAELGSVLARYRERPTMGKLGLTVVPVVAFLAFGGIPDSMPGTGHLIFDVICLLLFVWGVYELTHSLASWLILHEDGIVYRGRRKVRWAHRWEDFKDVVLSHEVTYLGGSSRPISDKIVARLWTATGQGARQLSGNYFLTDVGAGLLRTFLRSPGNLTPMFAGIIDRVVEARVRHDLRELATEGGKVQYGHIELGGTYLYVKGAADEIPWDEVTRLTVDDHYVGITVPHLRRRMEGLKLKADGRRENYRVGGDNTLYIEDKDLSNCRKAIIWSVMSDIAGSIDAQPQ
ncbi:hypothetical protein GCM10015535_09810 [Streptomyces gelaticus]|uniref:PH domain-containing protein n=1 Tax=Streptomyces gelaticus TaxID=285446 RepID=A0ABQ2VT86_9ACTN|nr:hypothetical protein [Streptomyces gelaticus]GGV77152.1 hypothetical protein GCM10015535_09810 [Streptomyces gelaticus]